MWLYGNLINAQATLEEGKRKGDEAPGVVPKDWQLIRLKPGAKPEVVASGVAGYALSSDRLIFTNGSVLYERNPDGSLSELHRLAGIQKAILL